MLFRVVSTAMWALVVGAGIGSAQDLPAGPAERPPEGFPGAQYVDSRGCVYLRAGMDGSVTWVPRVTPDRKPLCGYPPSIAGLVEPGKPTAVEEVAAPAAPAVIVPPAPAPLAQDKPAATPDVAAATDPLMAGAAPAASPAVPAAAPPAAAQAASKRADTTARPPRKAKPHRVALRPKAPRLPVVIHAHGAAELQAFRRLTIAPGEVVAPADLPAKVGCPVSAPQARRVALMDGGSTVLCTRPGHGLDGARVPVLPPLDTALAAAVVPKSGPSVAPAVPLARRYVQIGAFSVPANAERALDRLQSLGLPAAVSRGQLDVVMAGPFADTQAIRAALTAARSAGYTDAFIRS